MKPRHPTYWRSYAQLADDPGFRDFVEREFPAGASELPEGIPRRQMLMLLGASLSLAGIAGCRKPVEHIVPYVDAPEQVIPGVPRHYATTMPFGHSAYGLVVESHEGRPTKIEGNPEHPTTAGRTGPWMQAAILDLYDPDRSRRVLRLGEPSGWEAFVAAWQELDATLVATGGQGLAVLAAPFSSPTLARLAAAFRARYPNARWATWEPLGDENVREGLRRATGVAAQPVHDLERAARIVALDADFLQTDPEMVSSARGFAAGRRNGVAGGEMNRLYAIESVYTVTGANADHRLRLRSGEIGGFVAALAAELAARGLAIEAAPGARPPAGVDPQWIGTLAADLLEHRGASVLIAGASQPPAVHAALVALNAALGNVGRTVRYPEPRDAALSSTAELSALAEAMRSGEVTTLVLLDSNPVYSAPADLDFAEALSAVEHTIHLGSHRDETALGCEWHLPRAHFLEAWGDCRDASGAPGVTQPLVQPLFGGRSDVELLGLLAGGEARPGHDLVRETWRGILGELGFEQRWNRLLHDGVLPGSPAPGATPRVGAGLPADLGNSGTGAAEGLELVFRGSPAVHDGRFANNAWLQELPDTMTKLTWDNAALVSPATAAELGLANEDVVRIGHEGRELELPVWIVPGHADGSIAVWLGYGRSAAGRIGNGVGANAYAVRTTAAPWFAGGATLTRTDRKHELASTQDHGSMEQRPLVRESTVDGFRRQPDFAQRMVKMPPLEQLIPDHDYATGYQWGMSIDLNVCTGCNACVVACQSENNVPVVGKQQVRNGREMHWLRVDRYFVSDGGDPAADPAPRAVFQAVPCMHCENAPCEQVCPVAATVHDDEGLNVMVYNRCIGTRYCSNNCPYKVRRFNFFNFTKHTPEIVKLAQNPDVTVRSRGVMEKCTYCTQRIAAARIQARLEDRELRDGEVRTACQQACPTEAIAFGNIRDPESRVSRLKAEPRDYAMLAELNNRPRTTFLAKLNNPHPDLAPAADPQPGDSHGAAGEEHP